MTAAWKDRTPEIVERFKAGERMNRIAADLGCSTSTVSTVLIADGAHEPKNRSGSTVTDPTVVAQIVARYDAGASIRKVAAEFGTTYGIANRLLHRHTTLRAPGGRRPPAGSNATDPSRPDRNPQTPPHP